MLQRWLIISDLSHHLRSFFFERMDENIGNNEELIEFIAPVIAIPAVVLYHIILGIEVMLSPYRTTFGTNYHERRFWAIKVLAKEGNEVMGVQSIRNSMFVSTLLASTAVGVMFGVLETVIPLVCFLFWWHSNNPSSINSLII